MQTIEIIKIEGKLAKQVKSLNLIGTFFEIDLNAQAATIKPTASLIGALLLQKAGSESRPSYYFADR